MTKQPTYSAKRIKEMAIAVNDADSLKVLTELINEEIELYEMEDLAILSHASMILFTKSFLAGATKNLK